MCKIGITMSEAISRKKAETHTPYMFEELFLAANGLARSARRIRTTADLEMHLNKILPVVGNTLRAYGEKGGEGADVHVPEWWSITDDASENGTRDTFKGEIVTQMQGGGIVVGKQITLHHELNGPSGSSLFEAQVPISLENGKIGAPEGQGEPRLIVMRDPISAGELTESVSVPGLAALTVAGLVQRLAASVQDRTRIV
jgi:hypothetical protein